METNTNPKMTNYDKKLQARREAEAKEKKQNILTGVITAAIVVCIIAVLIVIPITKKKAVFDTHVVVGEHEVSLMEYNYYYASTVNQFLNVYSSVLPYLGLDTTQSFAAQQYNEDLTWQDFFEHMTRGLIVETKTLVDEAKANNFSYDVAADYAYYTASITSAAQSQGMSEKKYYESFYGDYATKEALKPIMEEYLFGQAYYEALLADNAPTEEEITTYYEENKKDYDTVDYRIFTISADVAEGADEATVTAAMEAAKATADKMAERVKAGEDFAELCREYAPEDKKESYADDKASLKELVSYSSANSLCSDWLFDEARAINDVTVTANVASNSYYVVTFLGRDFDVANRETISNTLASETVAAQLEDLTKEYTIKDTEGNVIYTPGDTLE